MGGITYFWLERKVFFLSPQEEIHKVLKRILPTTAIHGAFHSGNESRFSSTAKNQQPGTNNPQLFILPNPQFKALF
jgi:hypothetical protein